MEYPRPSMVFILLFLAITKFGHVCGDPCWNSAGGETYTISCPLGQALAPGQKILEAKGKLADLAQSSAGKRHSNSFSMDTLKAGLDLDSCNPEDCFPDLWTCIDNKHFTSLCPEHGQRHLTIDAAQPNICGYLCSCPDGGVNFKDCQPNCEIEIQASDLPSINIYTYNVNFQRSGPTSQFELEKLYFSEDEVRQFKKKHYQLKERSKLLLDTTAASEGKVQFLIQYMVLSGQSDVDVGSQDTCWGLGSASGKNITECLHEQSAFTQLPGGTKKAIIFVIVGLCIIAIIIAVIIWKKMKKEPSTSTNANTSEKEPRIKHPAPEDHIYAISVKTDTEESPFDKNSHLYEDAESIRTPNMADDVPSVKIEEASAEGADSDPPKAMYTVVDKCFPTRGSLCLVENSEYGQGKTTNRRPAPPPPTRPKPPSVAPPPPPKPKRSGSLGE